MLEEEAGHQLTWKTEPQPSSLSTTARLMNILEAKHQWKSVAPHEAVHLQQKKGKIGSTNPLGRLKTKSTNSPAASLPGRVAPAQILPPNADASHPSRRHNMSSTHSVWARSG
jgi:hypothetical protein